MIDFFVLMFVALSSFFSMFSHSTATTISAAPIADYTVLVYMNGSDLESDDGFASDDLDEMMSVGSSANMNVVVETGSTNHWYNPKISSKMNQRWHMEKGVNKKASMNIEFQPN